MENKFNALDTKLNIILSKIDKNLWTEGTKRIHETMNVFSIIFYKKYRANVYLLSMFVFLQGSTTIVTVHCCVLFKAPHQNLSLIWSEGLQDLGLCSTHTCRLGKDLVSCNTCFDMGPQICRTAPFSRHLLQGTSTLNHRRILCLYTAEERYAINIKSRGELLPVRHHAHIIDMLIKGFIRLFHVRK
jgi:hypothetical protein